VREKGRGEVSFWFRLRVKLVDSERVTNRIIIEMGSLTE
jgi:hypothetical protein